MYENSISDCTGLAFLLLFFEDWHFVPPEARDFLSIDTNPRDTRLRLTVGMFFSKARDQHLSSYSKMRIGFSYFKVPNSLVWIEVLRQASTIFWLAHDFSTDPQVSADFEV